MLKEITLKSRFKYGDSFLTFQQWAIVNPLVILANFENDNRLVLSEDTIVIVNKLDSELKSKLLAMSEKRRELDEFKKNRGVYSCSSDLNRNDYNNRLVREYVNRQLLFGI
jgi:hypothetical protein